MNSPTSVERPGSLYEKAQALLKKDERSLFEISKATGLPFYWLKKIRDGAIADPSVNRIQELYEKLSGKKISV